MDYYLGEIELFAISYVPEGWMLCDGRSLNINQNMALYSLLSNTYGGNSNDSFCIPDLRGKEPIPNLKYCICVSGIYPVRP